MPSLILISGSAGTLVTATCTQNGAAQNDIWQWTVGDSSKASVAVGNATGVSQSAIVKAKAASGSTTLTVTSETYNISCQATLMCTNFVSISPQPTPLPSASYIFGGPTTTFKGVNYPTQGYMLSTNNDNRFKNRILVSVTGSPENNNFSCTISAPTTNFMNTTDVQLTGVLPSGTYTLEPYDTAVIPIPDIPLLTFDVGTA